MSDRSKSRVERTLLGVVLAAFLTLIAAGRSTGPRAEPASEPPVATFEYALATRLEAIASGAVGRIEIPRLSLTAPIIEGISTRVMDHGVGRIMGTAFPGEAGNVGLAAHRTTHFRDLGRVLTGDRIRVSTPDGVFDYQVDSAFVVTPTRTDVLAGDGVPRLTLITCFPFDWKGPAPMRYVVQASAIGTELSTTSRKVALD